MPPFRGQIPLQPIAGKEGLLTVAGNFGPARKAFRPPIVEGGLYAEGPKRKGK
jgi:hypothetical protein